MGIIFLSYFIKTSSARFLKLLMIHRHDLDTSLGYYELIHFYTF